MESLTPVLIGLAVLLAVALLVLRSTTVLEYERGLKYVRGKLRRVLGPGQYVYCPVVTTIRKIDVRPRVLPVPGQEVLSSDGIGLKLSLAATCAVEDPAVAVNEVQDFQAALYLALQSALREIVGAASADAVLEGRGSIGERLLARCAPRALELGLRLSSVSVKDIMLPGPLKQTFARVLQARKEGEAALERARGETAALRSLANAARMLEGNPALLQLRLLHAVGGSTGNTLALGLPPGKVVAGVREPEPAREGEEPLSPAAGSLAAGPPRASPAPSPTEPPTSALAPTPPTLPPSSAPQPPPPPPPSRRPRRRKARKRPKTSR